MDWPSHLINVVGHKLASSCYALAQPLTTLENISFVEIFFLRPDNFFSSAAVIMSKLKSQRIVISFYFPYLIFEDYNGNIPFKA